MIDKDRFGNFYQNDIQKKVDELNSTRAVVAPAALFVIVIGLAAPAFFIYAILSYKLLGNAIIATIIIMICVFSMILLPAFGYGFVTHKYRTTYKHNIISKALSEISDKCEYKQNKGLPEAFFNSTLLFAHYPAPNSYHSEDLFVLKKDANAVIFSEVGAMCGHKSSKRTIFKGLLGFFPVGTKYMNPIVIRSRELDKSASPGAILSLNFDIWTKRFGGLKEINFGDEDFDDSFRVYAATEKKTKELLTPQIRAGILNIKKGLDSDLHFSFYKGLLYIAIPGKRDLFDPPVFSTIDKELIFSEFRLIEAMFNLIETLNIDVKEQDKKSAEELMQIINSF